MDSLVTLEQGQYGLKAILRRPWSDEIADYLAGHEIIELELNLGKGWWGNNIEFIRNFQNLKVFKLLHLNFEDFSPIYSHTNLVELQLETYSRMKLEFDYFPNLIDCSFRWAKGGESIFGCMKLQRLFISAYKGADLMPFGQLKSLTSLGIVGNSGVIDLKGLSPLTQLHSLRIAAFRKLESLDGIEGMSRLEELDINACKKLDSIDALRNLMQLQRLSLNNIGDLASLNPLKGLVNIEMLSFYESTNIVDGDLSPLLNLKKLDTPAFMNRKHYSHKRDEFWSEDFKKQWINEENWKKHHRQLSKRANTKAREA